MDLSNIGGGEDGRDGADADSLALRWMYVRPPSSGPVFLPLRSLSPGLFSQKSESDNQTAHSPYRPTPSINK